MPHSSHQVSDLNELIHQNAILGCQSWSEWEEIYFESSPVLTWYRSPIRDILFNSVLSANFASEYFEVSLKEVSHYCTEGKCPIAWLIPQPNDLTEKEHELFRRYGFRECAGTTGMSFALSAEDSTAILTPRATDISASWKIRWVTDMQALKTWGETLIAGYEFPLALKEPWIELHSSIGFHGKQKSLVQNSSFWKHILLEENGEAIATCSLFCGDSVHGASFANLAVIPSHRGKGIGTHLVRESLRHLKQMGYSTITLYASGDAFRLYSRLGFKVGVQNIFFVHD